MSVPALDPRRGFRQILETAARLRRDRSAAAEAALAVRRAQESAARAEVLARVDAEINHAEQVDAYQRQKAKRKARLERMRAAMREAGY